MGRSGKEKKETNEVTRKRYYLGIVVYMYNVHTVLLIDLMMMDQVGLIITI
jgi:hypothetical protein